MQHDQEETNKKELKATRGEPSEIKMVSASSLRKTCKSGHTLHEFSTPHSRFTCDGCNAQQGQGTYMFGCRACDFDLCMQCSKV